MAGFSISDTIGMLSGRISYLDDRHKLILDNIAHADTPGYKSKDLEFNGFLKAAADGDDATLMQGDGSVSFKPKEDITIRDGHAKADGNNVSVESEMANLTDNSLEFMTATEILKRQLSLLKYSLSER